MIGVAITVRNDRARLLVLLDALARQTTRPEEVVLVDAASTDGTFEAAEAFAKTAPFPLRLVQEPCTRGAGRSRAVEMSTSEWVAFLDSDTKPPPDWLARYAARLDKAEERLGGVGGAQRAPPDASDLQKAVDDVMAPMEAASFGGLNTGNACYRRAALLEVGLFDPALQTAEDPDLNARLMKVGWRLERIENPVATDRRGSWRALVRQHVAYGRGAVALLARHPEFMDRRERLVAPLGAATVVALLALALVVSPLLLLPLVAGLVGIPLVVHRRLVRAFWHEHGPSPHFFQRLGVLFVVYVPYHVGVLVGRFVGRGVARTRTTRPQG